MSVTALVFQKAVIILRPLCLPNSCTRVTLSGLVVSSPEDSDKAAIKKRVRKGKHKCFCVDFFLYIHAKQLRSCRND